MLNERMYLSIYFFISSLLYEYKKPLIIATCIDIFQQRSEEDVMLRESDQIARVSPLSAAASGEGGTETGLDAV